MTRRKRKRYTNPAHSLDAILLPFTVIAKGARWLWRKAKR